MRQKVLTSIKRKKDTWISILLLLLLPFLLFRQVWWFDSSQRLLFENGDFVEQNIAMRRFVAGEVREGRLPLWDPYTYGGEPAIAGSLFAPYYPLGWWQFLFPAPFPDVVLPLEVIFHLAIGGIGAFLLVRQLTGNTQAGLLSAVAFELSGWATSYPMLQVGILETAVWLPWGLWSIERGLAHRSWRWLSVAAVCFGVALLAGHPQTLMYLAYLSAVYYIVQAWSLRVGGRFFIGGGLLIGIAVLGIGAAQWLPAIEAYPYSPRSGLSYAEVANGFSLHELLGLFRANYGEWSPLYMGIVPLALSIVGIFARRKVTVFWLVVAVIAVLVALGANGFAYPIAYRVLPGFAIFRNQERIALLYMMAVTVLSGYGWAALTQRWRVPLVAFAGVVLLTVADLAVANGGVILERNTAGYYPTAPVVDYLHSVGDATWRVSSEGNLPDGPNAGMVYRLRDVVGNGPLHLAALDTFVDTLPETRWWQLLNVQHVLTTREFPEGSPVVAVMENDLTPRPPLQNGEGETDDKVVLYQVFVGATPVWIVHDYEVATSQAEAIAHTAIVEEPHRTAILEREPALSPADAVVEEQATVTHFSPQKIVTSVNLSSAALIIWSEMDYPGWVARANGERLETYRTYGLLRAVALPAGQYEVVWTFEPPLAYAGITISLITLIALLVVIIRSK